MIKMLMIALLTIFFTSCNDIPHQQVCDISFKHNRCRCGLYDLNKLKPLEEGKNYPLTHCEGVYGIHDKPLAEVVIPKAKENIRYCKDLEEYNFSEF